MVDRITSWPLLVHSQDFRLVSFTDLNFWEAFIQRSTDILWTGPNMPQTNQHPPNICGHFFDQFTKYQSILNKKSFGLGFQIYLL